MQEDKQPSPTVSADLALQPAKKLNRWTLILTASALAFIGVFVVFLSHASTSKKVPSEFIARLYTESYGRLPDQVSWNKWESYYSSKGCTTDSTAAAAKLVYASTEFTNLPYNNQARIFSLYRGVLSREPDTKGFNYWLTSMSSGRSFGSVVDSILASSEFKRLSATICNRSITNYPLTGKPFAIATHSNDISLQARLNAATPGSVVTLKPSELVDVTKQLIVKRGVTLTTQGNAGINGRHAQLNMARLVRANAPGQSNKDSIVVLMPGAKLTNIWIDGQMTNHKQKDGSQNISIYPSNTPSTVEFVRSDNPINGQNIILQGTVGESNYSGPIGSQPDRGCKGKIDVSNNLVVNSANLHSKTASLWSDGIGTSCGNSQIHDNEVLDASDVGIIAYRSLGQQPQSSQIYNNRILQAGNEAFGGIVADPLSVHFSQHDRKYPSCMTKQANASEPNCDFSGLVFRNNTLWSGPDVRFVIMASAGTRAWSFFYGCSTPAGSSTCTSRGGPATGSGGAFTNNTTGISSATTQLPMYISGIHNLFARNNFSARSLLRIKSGSSANPANKCSAGSTPLLNLLYAAKTDAGGNKLKSSKTTYQLPDVGNGFRIGSADKCI